jgi:NitT/TauT family transport system substrate-binding protein
MFDLWRQVMLIGQPNRIGKLLYPLVVAVALAALSACTSSGSSDSMGVSGAVVMPGPAGALEQTTITVEAVPTADEAGLYIANDLQYFAQEGLTVKIAPTGGGELAVPDLTSGKANLVAGNYVSFVQAQISRKADLRIIANGSLMQPGNQAVYVMPSSKIKTVADLASHPGGHKAKIGVNTLHNIGQLLIGSLLQDNGYGLQDVSLVPPTKAGNPFANELSELSSGTIDAAWLPEPFATIAEQNFGAVKVADFDQGSMENFPIGTYIGTTKWVTSHPNTVAAFLRALQKGQQKADTDRGQVETSLIKNTMIPNGMKQDQASQIASLMTINSYPLIMDIKTMQRVSDSMYAFNLEPGLKGPYNITSMVQWEPGTIGMSPPG